MVPYANDHLCCKRERFLKTSPFATTVVQEATLEPLGGDVAVSRVLAQPRWKVRLRESVPLREGKHKGVNAACRWGAGWVIGVVRAAWCYKLLRRQLTSPTENHQEIREIHAGLRHDTVVSRHL